MKIHIHILLLLLLPTIVFAQQRKTLHQTFEIEEVERLNFNLAGEIEVEKWAGNTILTETKIEVHDASKGIFSHFLKSGRYEMVIGDTPSAKASTTGGYEVNEDYFNDDVPTTAEEPVEAEIEAVEEVIEAPVEGGVYLSFKDKERKPIRTRTGECLEIVKIRIFIPEDFNQSGENSYFRTLPDDDDD